jgi:hypothetical protein
MRIPCKVRTQVETCPGSDLANGHDAAGNNESKTWEFCPFAAALGAPAALSDSDAPIPSLEQARSNERWSAYVDIANILDEEYVANHSVRNVATANDAILNPGEPLSAYVGIRRRFE